ncbi:hypothetical protein PUV54_03160 [Hyphococcus flavus]|uniref:Uncharacterized protein n=1 Tax=Hyphococcus flavus TaxID=1866326 RepID=A0AAE9ZKB1_9PROT|nr:hypothetical protein [Hyphococcus flavus]WDI32190.1 hypothetical protein PUV54_03160 [Hyphococcus flavus]
MLLRRVIEHVRAQNWTAVALDFVIVVVGVFIGIQVANWNEAQAAKARETELLAELKREIETSIRLTNQKRDAIAQVVSAGERSLDFITSGASCGAECWPILVDFFHASQWQPIDVDHSTYDEMRRQGLPRSRAVIDAVEGYLSQNAVLTSTHLLPPYRSLVRQNIPVDAQSYYWDNCYDLDNGAETYVLDCPRGVSREMSAAAVNKIINNPDIELFLTEWTGLMWSTPSGLGEQNTAAQTALDAIEAELEKR